MSKSNILHIGNRIDEVRQQKRVTYASLARLSGRHISGMNKTLQRETLQTSVIWAVSKALKHNCWEDLAQELEDNTDFELDSANAATTQTLEELQTENQRLKEELHYLRISVKALADKVENSSSWIFFWTQNLFLFNFFNYCLNIIVLSAFPPSKHNKLNS